jgi:CMP-2-keto-3-deoxyoctulosonic acid synthetase
LSFAYYILQKGLRSIGLLPARLLLYRLPNNVLADIGGMPMFQRVLDSFRQARSAESEVLCTYSAMLQARADGCACMASFAFPLMALAWG